MATIERIKTLAQERGISLSFLCKKMNVARVYFNDIQKHGREIPPDKLQIIANCLNTTVPYLLGMTDQKEKPTAVTGEQKVPFENIMALLSDLPEDQIDRILACVERFVQIPEDKLPQALEYLEYLSKLK